jgi:hypothetical protein
VNQSRGRVRQFLGELRKLLESECAQIVQGIVLDKSKFGSDGVETVSYVVFRRTPSYSPVQIQAAGKGCSASAGAAERLNAMQQRAIHQEVQA